MPSRKPSIGGNWKMNLDTAGVKDLTAGLIQAIDGAVTDAVDVTVFPPFPYLPPVAGALCDAGSHIRVGAQDASAQPNGAFTGEVSLSMLKDIGVSTVLVGHSERRHVIGESDELVNEKLLAALDAGFEVVLAIGEKLEQRESGKTNLVNIGQTCLGLAGTTAQQMAKVTLAYEPVWAIGTGKTATPQDAQDAHLAIRQAVASLHGEDVANALRIQYGGSMKPGNAKDLLAQPDIDGGLIGGAALKADDFAGIIAAAQGA